MACNEASDDLEHTKSIQRAYKALTFRSNMNFKLFICAGMLSQPDHRTSSLLS